MVRNRSVTRAVRIQKLYTGESVQVAHTTFRKAAGQGVLRPPASAQVLLEARVMSELRSGSWYWAHPLGFAGVWLHGDHPQAVLDSHTVVGERAHPMAGYVLQSLLPAFHPDKELSGIAGLRVGNNRRLSAGNLLRLVMLGTKAAIDLRGLPGTDWASILEEQRQSLPTGYRALWTASELSADEQAEADIDARSEFARIAWLGSALFRRIALFHTSSNAYSTRTWVTGDRWIIEMETARAVPLDHDLLITRLMHPVYGVPLRVADAQCGCSERRGRWGTQCRFRLEHRHGKPGTLQLRFNWINGGYRHHRQKYTEVGANRAWLDRVLPPAGRLPVTSRAR